MKHIICLAILGIFAGHCQAQKESPVRIGWIHEGLSREEAVAVRDYLQQQKGFTSRPLSFSGLTAANLEKNHLTHIWWLSDDTAKIKEEEKNAGPLLRRFVEDGGHLILSMEAVKWLNDWGIEKNKFDIKEDSVTDEGFGRPCGFHAFLSHPLFQGLHGGAYIWKGKTDDVARKIGFFGHHLPDTAIAKVIGIGWTYITFHEDEKLVLEYHLGKGSIIAVGAYTYFSRPNFNVLQLYRFYNNIFNYTAGRIRDVKARYWSFLTPQVIPWKEEFKPLSIAAATRWKLPLQTMQLSRQKATADFADAVGRRILLMGKEKGGIEEIWTHPFMAFRDISTGIQLNGSDSVTWLNNLTPVIRISPEMLIRVYSVGGDTLREMITVDFDKPVAVIHYEWNMRRIRKVWIKYTSDLRLMWPYSDTCSRVMRYQWSGQMNAALAGSPHTGQMSLMGFSCKPQDHLLGRYKGFSVTNGIIRGISTPLIEVSGIFSFNAAELQGKLNVCLVGGSEGADNTMALYRKTMPALNDLYHRSSDYYKQLLRTQLMITTPDATFNEGYRWAMIRSDQFLETTPGLGTSMMAGFGTTARGWNGRQQVSGRPGYAWYFGRDGAWSAMALDAMGGFEKTKAVLALFVKYQAVNGKIFHELTSSGTVHYDAADATPLFVILASHYLHYAGDTGYIRSIWPAIKKAMDFCYGTDTDQDGLIENTNVGHGWIEGGPLFGTHTEFYLAGSWAAALEAAGYIAKHLGLESLAGRYGRDAQKVKKIIDTDFWSARQHHFYNGKMLDGSYMQDATVLAAVPIYFGAVTDAQKAAETTRSFACSEFSTDWGMRMIPEDNPKFNPLAYHAGMVWPLFSGYASLAEYKTGCYTAGFTHLMDNLLQYRQGALGSVEETLNGAVNEPAGVCSQQAWSETMVIQPVIEGMLGLVPDALSDHITLSPRFPWNWKEVTVSNIREGSTMVNMQMHHSAGQYHYDFEKKDAVLLSLDLNLVLPPGTHVMKVLTDGTERSFTQTKEGEAVKIHLVSLHIRHSLQVSILYEGGTGVLPLINDPLPGARNTGAKIVGQEWQQGRYTVQVEGIPGKTYHLDIYSAAPVRSIRNGTIKKTADNIYEINTVIPVGENSYGKRTIIIDL